MQDHNNCDCAVTRHIKRSHLVKLQDFWRNESISSTNLTGTGRRNQAEILIDLVDLDIESPSPPDQQPPPSFPADLLSGSAAAAAAPQSQSPSAALSLLDEELLSFGNMQYDVVLLRADVTCFDTFVFFNRHQWTRFCSSYIHCNNKPEWSVVIFTGIYICCSHLHECCVGSNWL